MHGETTTQKDWLGVTFVGVASTAEGFEMLQLNEIEVYAGASFEVGRLLLRQPHFYGPVDISQNASRYA